MDSYIDMIDTIKYHIENNMIMKVQRDAVDKNEMVGFPLELSDELLLMSHEFDFIGDGYLVLRVSDITDAYSKESEGFYEEMCIKEGLLDKAINNNPLKNVNNWKSVFEQLIDYDKYISIQCELDETELIYSIGRIVKVEDDKVYFNYFDLDGVWEDKPRIIPFDIITCVDIDDNYCNTYSKYLKYPF